MPSAIFVANRANRSREESAQVATQIEIATDAAQVDQRIEYAVRYEPVKELVFEATAALPIDGESVDVVMLTPAGGDTELAEQRTPLRLGADRRRK